MLFLFDPTQDPRFRRLCQEGPAAAGNAARTGRQESVLLEAATRVRRHTGLPQNVRHNRPLVVVVTKYDSWASLLDGNTQTPSIRGDRLDVESIEQRSQSLRQLMLRVCPEVVTAAEGFADQVTYVPVSALGCSPQPDPRTRALAVRPRDLRPVWATVPLLYGLSRATTGLIPTLRRKPAPPGGNGPPC
jgi:hypothetical protein